jgi:hypothetical protein
VDKVAAGGVTILKPIIIDILLKLSEHSTNQHDNVLSLIDDDSLERYVTRAIDAHGNKH